MHETQRSITQVTATEWQLTPKAGIGLAVHRLRASPTPTAVRQTYSSQFHRHNAKAMDDLLHGLSLLGPRIEQQGCPDKASGSGFRCNIRTRGWGSSTGLVLDLSTSSSKLGAFLPAG